MTHNNLWRCLARIAFGATLALVLAGCDAYYALQIENHTDQEVTVRVLRRSETVPPCTIIGSLSVSSPLYGQPISVQVESPSSGILYEPELPPAVYERGRPPVRVVLRPEGPDVCPAPIEGQFVLVAENRTPLRLELIYLGESLGVLAPGEEREFGPLEGEILDLDRSTRVVEESTRERPTGLMAVSPRYEYSLGEMPTFHEVYIVRTQVTATPQE